MDWEDEEKEVEEFVHQPFPKYQFTLKDQKHYECTTLIIGLYGAGGLFAHSVMKSNTISNRLNFSKAKQQSLADIYENGDGLVYLIFNDEVDKMKQVHFSDFISRWFKFGQCIVLASESKANLNDPSNVCLRTIFTNSWTEQSHCAKFSQGLMGLGADLLIWAELNRIPLCCFIGIMGQYELNRQIVDSVFGSLRGKYGMNENVETYDRIRKYNMKKYSNKLYL